MKATALGDKIRIESESQSDIATMNLITRERGRIAILGDTLNVGPDGVRSVEMTIGQWKGALQSEIVGELALTDGRNASLEHLLDAIPPCPAHGEGCIPHALEWIKVAKEAMDSK